LAGGGEAALVLEDAVGALVTAAEDDPALLRVAAPEEALVLQELVRPELEGVGGRAPEVRVRMRVGEQDQFGGADLRADHEVEEHELIPQVVADRIEERVGEIVAR